MVWYSMVWIWVWETLPLGEIPQRHLTPLTPCQGHFLLSWRVPLFSKCSISPPTTLRKLFATSLVLKIQYMPLPIDNSNFRLHLCQGGGWLNITTGPPSARGTFSTPQGGHTFLRTPAAPAPETIFFGHLGVTFTAVPVPRAIYSPLLPGPQLTNIVDSFTGALYHYWSTAAASF